MLDDPKHVRVLLDAADAATIDRVINGAPTKAERQEPVRLRRENRVLRMERGLLC